MNFCYFDDTIFRKDNFERAIIKKDTITIFFKEGDSLVRKCDDEKMAKGAMRELYANLNSDD